MKQKEILDGFIDTSRYVYNKTVEEINNGHKANFQELRDLLVTDNTKKGLDEYKAYDNLIDGLKKRKMETQDDGEKKKLEDEIKNTNKKRRIEMKAFDSLKNERINSFEIETPKDIRSCAVKRCCDAFKTGFTNLKNGNIKFFNMKYKNKIDAAQTIELTPKIISIKDSNIRIAPTFFKDNCILKVDKHNKRKIKNLKIENNVDITRFNNEYFLYLCIKTETKSSKLGLETKLDPVTGLDPVARLDTVAGVDLGIRTFATVHSNKISNGETTITEYKHRADLLYKLNAKINMLKHLGRRVRKKQFSKIEKRKSDIVDNLHWNFINDLLVRNDVIYIGDIKSHDIVKDGKNKYLNVSFNDLKFYKLKQRLIYKAYITGKKVLYVQEHHTTKTCSSCGVINENVGTKKVFECSACKLIIGRDINASKNMKMKGMLN